MNIEFLSLIVQSIEAIAVVGALIYAGLQIRESRRIAKIESTREAFKELSEEDVRASRSYIYRNRDKYKKLSKDGSNLKKLTKVQWHHANAVCNSFDRVGFSVSKGIVPVELLEGYKYVIGRSWIMLESFVEANRSVRSEPTFKSYFEMLAKQMFEKYVNREDIKFM